MLPPGSSGAVMSERQTVPHLGTVAATGRCAAVGHSDRCVQRHCTYKQQQQHRRVLPYALLCLSLHRLNALLFVVCSMMTETGLHRAPGSKVRWADASTAAAEAAQSSSNGFSSNGLLGSIAHSAEQSTEQHTTAPA